MNQLDLIAQQRLDSALERLALGHYNVARALALEAAELFRICDRPRDVASALALAREAR